MDFSAILNKNAILQNYHRGKRCFVVGNGPSLNGHDYTLLENEVKICVNSFHNHTHFKSIPPNYWVLADPVYWKKRDEFLIPLLQAIETSHVFTNLVMPINGKISLNNSNFINIFYYQFSHDKKILDHGIDFRKPIPPYGQNVILVALMLAIYLGCNPIYIIGADHTWWRWKSEMMDERKIPHFYCSNYNPPKKNTSINSVKKKNSTDWYRTTVFVQRYQYIKILQHAMENGIEIYNASIGGELDIFPRVSYEDLFSDKYDIFTTNDILESIPNISYKLGNIAINLIKKKEFEAALTVIDSALYYNIKKANKCLGLNYLKALCLSGLGYKSQAINEARYECHSNPDNRDRALSLMNILNDRSSV